VTPGRDRRALGRRRRSSVAAVTLFAAVVAFIAPGAASAQDTQTKLVLLPVGQPGSWFDLTMRPGATRHLEVEIGNAGDAAIAARTYASDVYTIINGGFGGRLRNDAQTGATRWLDYPTEVIELRVGKDVHRTFAVTVPADAEPGEYITSVVLENDQPIRGTGEIALDQVIRQAVAVVVTVPGPRAPAVEIGAATHSVVAGKSVVSVAIENSGNVRLKPIVDVTLLDGAGAEVSRATVPMDTFYAHTDTFVEMALGALLLPGPYTVRLTLGDAAADVVAGEAALAFVVEAPALTTMAKGEVPVLAEVLQGLQVPTDSDSTVLVVLALFAGLGLGGLGIGALVIVRHRRRVRSEGRR
jgi:hypothetical protein